MPFHSCYCVIPFRCRTVSLETGMQNTQLCSTIVQLSFNAEQLELMFTFPLIYSIFQLTFAGMILGGIVQILIFSVRTLLLLLLSSSASFSVNMQKTGTNTWERKIIKWKTVNLIMAQIITVHHHCAVWDNIRISLRFGRPFTFQNKGSNLSPTTDYRSILWAEICYYPFLKKGKCAFLLSPLPLQSAWAYSFTPGPSWKAYILTYIERKISFTANMRTEIFCYKVPFYFYIHLICIALEVHTQPTEDWNFILFVHPQN